MSLAGLDGGWHFTVIMEREWGKKQGKPLKILLAYLQYEINDRLLPAFPPVKAKVNAGTLKI